MKKIAIAFIIVAVVAGAIGYKAYTSLYAPNTNFIEKQEIFIETGSDYESVSKMLNSKGLIKDVLSFNRVARLMKYPESVKPGRYVLKPGASNKRMIGKLRAGNQDPIMVTISTGRFLSDIAGVVAPKIEADSLEILQALVDSDNIAALGLTPETAISQIIPNTYEFFWNTSATQFAERMKREADKFWGANDRMSKLAKLEMTKAEVATLASIVQKESNLDSEKPKVAGVYLNRIRQGIPLQADPTIVFGLKAFSIRRVLNRHVNTPHPYNTHLNKGLPPGPICLPMISSIDAVLDAEQHDYIFFCAKPGYNNGHVFAVTNAEHERNARVYHRWLDSEGIRG